MGHANAEQLKANIMDALSGLYHDKLLKLSSDGPNVMKALQKKAIQDINKDIVDIGTCNIHKTHNAFSAAYEAFDSSIETLGLQVFQCFKYSAAKREDYELAQAKVKVTAHFFLRHVESRWTTLEDVVVRLAEQLPALKQYFLKHLPAKERESRRVKTICQTLQDKLNLAEMYFIRSVLELFTRITRMFQTSAPLIHILYDEMNTLVVQLMRRCLKPEAIGERTGKDLYKVDLEKEENWKREVDIGEAAKAELKKLKDDKKISDASYSSFFRRPKQLYQKAISELLRTFPLKNSLLYYLQVSHPLARNAPQSKEAVKQVATRIKAFPRGEIDKLSDEWLEYMSEEIPEDWYCRTAENTDDDEGEATDDEDTAQSRDQVVKYKRIDVYWSKVGEMARPTGERKYSALMKLARIALTLNHSNADVERGFSKNKLLLTSHRTRLEMPAINGLRMVSSYVSRYGSKPQSLPFSRDVVNSIRSSHTNCEERRKKEKELKRKAEEDRGKQEAEGRQPDDLLKKKANSEALLKEGISLLDEAMKMKDKGRAMIKAEAANAIIQNARKAIEDVETAISKRDSQLKKRKT